MMSAIKLILASLLTVVAACGESANQEKSAKESLRAVKSPMATDAAMPNLTTRFVAGFAPNQRPADAPTVREFIPNNQQRKQLLTGISEPIPASLGFIDNQGAWYTPFNQPGMPGYYDLRNWHDKAHDPNHAGQ